MKNTVKSPTMERIKRDHLALVERALAAGSYMPIYDRNGKKRMVFIPNN